jgi:hypothetical protein
MSSATLVAIRAEAKELERLRAKERQWLVEKGNLLRELSSLRQRLTSAEFVVSGLRDELALVRQAEPAHIVAARRAAAGM